MPYNSTYSRRRRYNNRRRRPMTRKRTYRKKFNRKILIGNPRQKVYYYKRFANLPPVVAAVDGSDTLVGYNFNLTEVPGYTEFTALYDAYKICGLKLRFLPYYSQSTDQGGNDPFAPFSSSNNLRIFTCLDYNDSSAPVSINAIREYQNCKVTSYNKGHKRYFRPIVNLESTGNTTIQVFSGKNPWISTGTPALQHYALKLGIDTSLLVNTAITPGDVLLRVEATFYIGFKQPR